MHRGLTIYSVSIVHDLLDWVLTGATIAALLISVYSLWFTAHESKKARQRITDERQRQFDLQTLSKILDVTQTNSPRTRESEAAVTARIASLSPDVRALVPHTELMFSPDAVERDKLVSEIQSRSKYSGNYTGTPLWDWVYGPRLDAGGREIGLVTVAEHITAELTQAIRATALEPVE